MQLSIIIISYNTEKLLKQTISSLPKNNAWEIIVVDNASKDNSVKMLSREFPFVKVIENNKNLGFAKANNQAIKKAKGDYLLLLNSDTIVKKNAIETLINYLETEEKTGIASSQLLNENGSIQPQGGYLPNLIRVAFWMLFIDDLPYINKIFKPYQLREKHFFKKKIKLGWVSGTSMMIKKELIEKVGLLNENFFMYGEDVEYCLRAQKAGFNIMVLPESKVVHLGHKSSGGDPTNAIIGEYKAIKKIFTLYKTNWEKFILRFLLKTGALLRIIIFGILQGRIEAYEAYKKAFQVA